MVRERPAPPAAPRRHASGGARARRRARGHACRHETRQRPSGGAVGSVRVGLPGLRRRRRPSCLARAPAFGPRRHDRVPPARVGLQPLHHLKPRGAVRDGGAVRPHASAQPRAAPRVLTTGSFGLLAPVRSLLTAAGSRPLGAASSGEPASASPAGCARAGIARRPGAAGGKYKF